MRHLIQYSGLCIILLLGACGADDSLPEAPVAETCYFELEYSDQILFYSFDLADDLEEEVPAGWVRSMPLLYGQSIYFAGSCNFTIELIESRRDDLQLAKISEQEFLDTAAALSTPVVVAPMEGGEE